MAVYERFPPRKCKINDPLIQHGYNITSQGGEDGVIELIFSILDADDQKQHGLPRTTPRYAVEFGAWDGKHLSNTWNLFKNKSWRGILMEAEKDRYQDLCREYRDFPHVACLHRLLELKGDGRLDAVLSQHEWLPLDFDFLSIDVDGIDYHLWATLDQYQPKVVAIEFNPTIPNHIKYIQAPDMQVYQGSSLLALVHLAQAKGYELISTTTYNAFFIQRQFYPLFGIEDNALEFMHDVPMPMDLFQLYDGTLKFGGCKKLLWKKIPLVEERLQMVPKTERSFALAPEHQVDMSVLDQVKLRYHEVTLDGCSNSTDKELPWFIHQLTQAIESQDTPDFDNILAIAEYIRLLLLPTTTNEAVARIFYAQGDVFLFHRNDGSREAIQYYEQSLYWMMKDHEHEKASVCQKMGEAYLRQRKYHPAHYWLRESLATRPRGNLKALKSLAKFYSKQNQDVALKAIVQQIQDLESPRTAP